MKFLLERCPTDPQSLCTILAAVRQMAKLSGTTVSLRVAMAVESCPRCSSPSDLFIEPGGFCAVCWSILTLHSFVSTAATLS